MTPFFGGEVLRGVSEAATGSLVAAVWQGALLASVAALVLKKLPTTPAAARFAIWFALFLLLAGLPLLAFWPHLVSAAGVSSGHAAWLTLPSDWSEAVFAIWAGASLVRAVTLVLAAFRVRSLSRRATPLSVSDCPRMDAEVRGRRVQICMSDEVDRPSVIGFFRPKVLIPSELMGKLTADELAQVVLHEAGHLRRADDWLNLLQKIALVVFPLNPALVWVERRLCFERELACDEAVLRATGAPKAYASCLANLAEHRMTRRGIALVMGALGPESELRQRVVRILTQGRRMRTAHARLVTCGAVLALVGCAAALARAPQLVGFSTATQLQQEATSYLAEPVQATNFGALEKVRFDPSSSSAGKPTLLRDGAVEGRKAGTSATRLLSRRHTARSVVRVAPTSGWVVMTSTSTWWSDGGRVVMTSVRTASPAPTVRGIREPDDSAVNGSLSQWDVQQIPSYAAAVPVRGGWLIIQL